MIEHKPLLASIAHPYDEPHVVATVDLREYLEEGASENRDPLPIELGVPRWAAKRLHDGVYVRELDPQFTRFARTNALINVLDLAFREHRPVGLRPDDLLLPLVQALTGLRNAHAKKGPPIAKQVLAVRRDAFVLGSPRNDWEGVFGELEEKIGALMGTGGIFRGNFSTTTPLLSTCYAVANMDAYQAYLSYEVITFCGIPRVTLFGTLEDWKKLRVEALQAADTFIELEGSASSLRHALGKWLGKAEWISFWPTWRERLADTLDEIVHTANGTANSTFWLNIYRHSQESGLSGGNGWITLFFPLIQHTEHQVPARSMFEMCPHGYARGFDSFSKGVSVAPFVWKLSLSEIPMRVYAGQLGTRQLHSGVIAPAWGWIVSRDPSEDDNAILCW